MIDCVADGFADEVNRCQDTGKKVLLSIGGAAEYSETTIPSEEDAVRIADNIWNIFGAGGLDDETIMPIRPFGDVVFDGFDIGKSKSSPLGPPTPLFCATSHTLHRQRRRLNPALADPNFNPTHPRLPILQHNK